MTDADLLHEYVSPAAPVCGWPTWNHHSPEKPHFPEEVQLALWQRHVIAWLAEREPDLEIWGEVRWADATVTVSLPAIRRYLFGPTLDLALIAAVEALGKDARDADA